MGTSTFSGPIVSTNGFTGDLTGDVTGNLTGNVTGTVSGGITSGATNTEINEVADLSATGALLKVETVALTAGTHGTGSEVNTSITLPAKCVVQDIVVDVTTAEATASTKTIDIGTSTVSDDPDGFAVGISVAATGSVRPQATVTTGLNETYYSANTRGVLLSDFLVGTDAAGDFGVYREKPDTTSDGAVISVTSAEAFTEFAGTLIVTYLEIA